VNGLLALILFLRGDFRGALTTATGSRSTLYVRDPQALGAYLDGVKVPRWQQRVMFDLRILKVRRRGSDGTLTELLGVGPFTQLVRDDQIEITSSDAAYQARLAQVAHDAQDYAFVAELDAEDHFVAPLRDLLERSGALIFDHVDTGIAVSPGGTVVDVSLEQIVTQIGQGAQLGPPRNLHLLTHARHTGELMFSPTLDDVFSYVSYEAIEHSGGRLRVPDSYLEPRVNPPKLVIYGCDFARARPVLAKLKEKMNPNLQVYAASHFVGANFMTRDVIFKDHFMYMCKPCWVHSPVDLSRAEIILDLSSSGQQDANNVVITNARWEQLVPPVIVGQKPEVRGWFSKRALGFRMPARNLPGGTVAAAFNTTHEIGGMYRFPFTVTARLKTTATKAQFTADPVAALKAAVAAVTDATSSWHAAHPYPEWVRVQFASANEMIDGLDWSILGSLAYIDASHEIEAKGWGVKYCVMVPVQAPASASVPHSQRPLQVSYYADGSSTAHPDAFALTSSFWTSV
jgi:hypothetical protein